MDKTDVFYRYCFYATFTPGCSYAIFYRMPRAVSGDKRGVLLKEGLVANDTVG